MIENLKPSEAKAEREDFGNEPVGEIDYSLKPAEGGSTEEGLAAVRAELNATSSAENRTLPVDFKASGSTEIPIGKLTTDNQRPTTKGAFGKKLLNRVKTFIGLGAVMGALGSEAKGQDVAPTTVGAQPEVGPKVVLQSSPTAKPKIFKYDQKVWTPKTPEEIAAAERAAEKLRTGESFWGGNPGEIQSNEPVPVNPPSAPESDPGQQNQPSADNGGVVMGGYVEGGPTVHGGYVPGGGGDRRGVSRGGDRYYGPVSQDGYVKEYNAGGPRQAQRAKQLNKIVKNSNNEVITDGDQLFTNPFKGKFFKP